ncbi:MAG: NAD(P)/FAD-dependent oxidoreductase [Paracoccaceae bacterium]
MESLWQITSEERVAAPALNGNHKADLVIVGGGFTGCAAALEAAGQGARTILLEAAEIGHGGSGRNVGLVNAGLWLPPREVARAIGPERGARLNAALAEAPELVFDLIDRHRIACEPRRHGTLHCAHAPSGMRDLENRHAQQRTAGAPVTLLSAQEARDRTGSPRVHGALHDARAGTIQPLAYVHGLARAAMAVGAVLHQHSPVSSIRREAGAWRVETGQGTVTARALLVATNAYHLPMEGWQAPETAVLHFFQMATDPLPEAISETVLSGGEGCWDTATVMTSFRRDAAGRFILGAMGLPERGGRALHEGWARAKLARLYPQLDGIRFAHAWSGRIAVTGDHIPKIVAPGPDALAVFGYSGRGIAPGTLLGRQAAQALVTRPNAPMALDVLPEYRERGTRMRSLTFETGARAIHALERLLMR